MLLHHASWCLIAAATEHFPTSLKTCHEANAGVTPRTSHSLQWQQCLAAKIPGVAEGWFEGLWQLDQPDYAAFLFWRHAKARLCSQAFSRHCVERMHIVVRRPKPIPSGKCCCLGRLGRFLIHLQNITIGFWWQLHVWDSLQLVLDGSSEQWTGLESKGLLRSGSDSAFFPVSQGGGGSVLAAIYEISRGEPCAECFWDPFSAGDTEFPSLKGLVQKGLWNEVATGIAARSKNATKDSPTWLSQQQEHPGSFFSKVAEKVVSDGATSAGLAVIAQMQGGVPIHNQHMTSWRMPWWTRMCHFQNHMESGTSMLAWWIPMTSSWQFAFMCMLEQHGNSTSHDKPPDLRPGIWVVRQVKFSSQWSTTLERRCRMLFGRISQGKRPRRLRRVNGQWRVWSRNVFAILPEAGLMMMEASISPTMKFGSSSLKQVRWHRMA